MLYATTQTVAPAVEPVTAGDMRDHSRIDIDDEEGYLDGLCTAARQFAESYTHRALITQTWELRCDQFPILMHLPRGPLQSVSSVQYLDDAGDLQTVATSVYDVDTVSDPGVISLAYDQSWPSHRWTHHAVRMTFVAGYGAAPADVPMPIRQAIMMLAATWYENRETVAMGMSVTQIPAPVSVEAMLGPYRIAMP